MILVVSAPLLEGSCSSFAVVVVVVVAAAAAVVDFLPLSHHPKTDLFAFCPKLNPRQAAQ